MSGIVLDSHEDFGAAAAALDRSGLGGEERRSKDCCHQCGRGHVCEPPRLFGTW